VEFPQVSPAPRTVNLELTVENQNLEPSPLLVVAEEDLIFRHVQMELQQTSSR
jgi:hypothetical protein